MKENTPDDAQVSVLEKYQIPCKNYAFGALREGGIILQAKESEKIIEQICAVTEFWINQSGLSVSQYFVKEEIQSQEEMISKYTGTCEAIAIEMLSDESFRIRIIHKDKQDDLFIANPFVDGVSEQKSGTCMTFCFSFLKVSP